MAFHISKSVKFILAVAAQVAILFGIVLFYLAVADTGTEVLLRIQPVDPRDPLRGDYVTFQYDISTVFGSLFSEDAVYSGTPVYVPLVQNGAVWSAGYGIQRSKPTGGYGQVFMKGIVGGAVQTSKIMDAAEYRINYGIEQYFIPEGTGRDFSFQGKDAYARVVIDDEGNALIRGLIVDGKPWP